MPPLFAEQHSQKQNAHEVRVLCLTDKPELYAPYENTPGVVLEYVQSLSELVESLLSTPHNGIILEFRKMMRAEPHEKMLLNDFVESFPTLRVNISPETGELNALGSVEAFLTETCPAFHARKVRSNLRLHVQIPVELARHDDYDFKDPERCYTINASQGGLFISSSRDWTGATWIWLRASVLGDDTPILTHVRWYRPWGAPHAMSGVGVFFAQITDTQHAALCEEFLLRKKYRKPDQRLIAQELEAFLAELKQEQGL